MQKTSFFICIKSKNWPPPPPSCSKYRGIIYTHWRPLYLTFAAGTPLLPLLATLFVILRLWKFDFVVMLLIDDFYSVSFHQSETVAILRGQRFYIWLFGLCWSFSTSFGSVELAPLKVLNNWTLIYRRSFTVQKSLYRYFIFVLFFCSTWRPTLASTMTTEWHMYITKLSNTLLRETKIVPSHFVFGSSD